MGFRLTAVAVVLLLLVSVLFEVSAVVIDNNNKININNEDMIVESGLAGWLASAKAIVSSLLGGGPAVQAPPEKGMSTDSPYFDFTLCIFASSSSSSFVSISLYKFDF